VSDANVELARRAIEAFNAHDLDAMRALASEDFEYDWTRSIGPQRGVYRGQDGFLEFAEDQWSMFDEVRLEVHELIPCGDHVVVRSTTHGRGRGGVPVSANSAQLYTFDESRLVRITLYQDRDEALAAAAG
jgi:ketosteroid isomerase-like protein